MNRDDPNFRRPKSDKEFYAEIASAVQQMETGDRRTIMIEERVMTGFSWPPSHNNIMPLVCRAVDFSFDDSILPGHFTTKVFDAPGWGGTAVEIKCHREPEPFIVSWAGMETIERCPEAT